jgi:hypothetical protein
LVSMVADATLESRSVFMRLLRASLPPLSGG